MQLTSQLYKNGVVFFLAFFFLVVWGFWSSYFSDPSQLSSLALQFHGIVMTAWCVMLILQAYLIRAGRRPLHRAIGSTSYLLAPLIIVTPIVVVHQTLPMYPSDFIDGQLTPSGQVFLSGNLIIVVTFGLLYGLAPLSEEA